MKNFIYLFLVLLAFGCGRKGTKTIQDTPSIPDLPIAEEQVPENPDPPEEEATPPVEAPPYLVAALVKTGCYGICPNYEARLFSNGHLTYWGKEDVPLLGRYEAWTEMELLNKIKAEAQRLGYFSFAEVYPLDGKSLDDLPMTITSLNFDNREKSVINNYNSPRTLRQFEIFLEQVLLNVDWTKMDSGL